MSVQLLTFDLDDTLWPGRCVFMRAEERLWEFLEQQAPGIAEHFDARARVEVRQQVLADAPHLAHQLSKLRRQFISELLRQYGHTDAGQLAEAAYQVFLAARHQVRYFDDVHDTLACLRRRYTLAALSNGNANVARLGLDKYFAFHLNAESVGSAKPAPDMYQEALQRAGVSAPAAVHVGDHPHHDVLGADAVGMATVWLNRDGNPWELQQVAPTWEIRSLRQLTDILPPDPPA